MLDAARLLELIFVYIAEVSARKDYDEVILLLADMGKVLSGADRCSVWVIDEDGTTITTKVAQGIEPITMPITKGIVGDAITKGTRYIIDDVYQDPRFNQEIDKQSGYRTRSMMVVPMNDRDGKVIGAFQVINKQGGSEEFDQRDMERLTLATTYAAETILATQLITEIEHTQKEVVFTMGAIGESRSKETGNHVKRVAEYSKLLAQLAGLGEEEAELLKQASPMHDIGKVAIPDAVLNKKGRFNDEERRIMDTHATLGYEMLKNSQRKILQAAAIVAHQHHERWDGKGYPQKLSKEQIHIYGRITAIADVFDALGSDRVYKRAWDDERILNLFKEERGRQFDPHLVDLFLDNIEQFYEIRRQFRDDYKYEDLQTQQVNRIEVLGAYGTKAKGFGTSSFRLNKTTTIDAGNLLDALDEDSVFITDIYLTHVHLDHIVDIAYIIDNYFTKRQKTITLHGTKQSIEAIQTHFLNDTIWPDFSNIKLHNGEIVVRYEEIVLGMKYSLGDEEYIEAFASDHTVGSCGYIYTKEGRSVLITADTYSLESAKEKIKNDPSIQSAVVECSFPNSLATLAKQSKHLTPTLLFEQLEGIERKNFTLYINHIKPTYVLEVAKELEKIGGEIEPVILKDGDFVKYKKKTLDIKNKFYYNSGSNSMPT